VVERNTELTELYELSQEIGYTLSHKDLLQMLVSHLRNALSSDLAVGGLFMDGQRLLIVETNRPLNPAGMDALRSYWLEILETHGVVITGLESIPIEVVSAETFNTCDAPLEQIGSLISSPIQVDNEVVGILIAGNARQDAFGAAHARILETFANQAAAAIQRLAAMLAAEQKRLEGLVEHLPVGILLLDSEFRLLLANPLGKDILSVLNPDFTGGQLTYLGKQSVADLIARHTDLFPVEIVQPGLARRVFEAQARSAGKDSRQWVLALREVTQEREYQTRIQMQERLATVGQLAAGIAHDFNNIMAAILVYTDLLSEDHDIPTGSRERLLTIQQQVQRAASLIRQILDFSHRSVMEQSDLDLLPFLKELDKMLRRVLPETIQLELTYRQDSYLVHADPTRLQQAFMNLALNARDAMPNGGLLHFELSRILVQPGERPPMADMFPGMWIRISVRDTGTGISTDNLPHIFEPFFTTKAVGQGTGLGLAQVYGIIKQHDGFIDVKSRLGHGTVFTIFLPSLANPQIEEQAGEPRLQISGAGKTVLVVEDDLATREALQALLEAHHYGVVAANNGIEALDQLEDNHKGVDLIVSDVVMPQMGGLALYHTVSELWPKIKILFITGHPLEGENQKLLEKGNVMWLQKPFSAQNFNRAVYALLQE
jgi:signal transduction histidine kinase